MVGVRVISSSSVVPFSTPPSLEVIELMPWDLQLIHSGSIQKGLLFLKPNPAVQSFTTIVDHLRTSLLHTLDHFPLLAGRFHHQEHGQGNSSFSVVCNNAGAEFVHAVADDVTVSDIIDPLYVPRIVHSFFPLNGVFNYEGVTKPLFAVQVTELEDGFFIGITMNHTVGDGHSFWMFFNSWSEISRCGTHRISTTPSFSRSLPEGTRGKFPLIIPYRPEMNLSAHEMGSFPYMEERIFHFSREKIAFLKAKANAEISSAGVTISSFQALLAHLWRAVVRCQGLDDNKVPKLVVAIGARTRMRPPLGEGYFGNAVQVTVPSATKERLLDGGLGWAASEINKVVNQFRNEEVQEYLKSWPDNPRIIPVAKWDESRTISSSSPRFNVYGNDFGWGKPIAVRSGAGNKRNSKVTFFPGVQEGSIDIEAYLLPKTLSAMADDQEFMEAVVVAPK